MIEEFKFEPYPTSNEMVLSAALVDAHRNIHSWHDQAAKVSGKSAFVPLKFQLGEAFQFDWSEELLVIGGIHRKLLGPTPSYAHPAPSGWWRTRHKATKCCSMLIPVPSPHWAALLGAASTTI